MSDTQATAAEQETPEQEAPELASLPVETRLALAEEALGQVFGSLELASEAINRLEVFLFSLIRVLNQSESITLEQLEEARVLLKDHDDLVAFWKHDETSPS